MSPPLLAGASAGFELFPKDADPNVPEVAGLLGSVLVPNKPPLAGLGVVPPDPNNPVPVVCGASVLAPKSPDVASGLLGWPKTEVAPVVEDGAPNLAGAGVADGVVDPAFGDSSEGSPVSISSSGTLFPASLRADPKADPNMDDPEGAGALLLSS